MKHKIKTTMLSLTLTISAAGLMGFVPNALADMGAAPQVTVAPQVRSELVRVKQNVAFAENLQMEAKHDPQDIYRAIDDSIGIVEKLLASSSLSQELKGKLEAVKAGLSRIKHNINDKAAYSEVRSLLEPLADNPGE